MTAAVPLNTSNQRIGRLRRLWLNIHLWLGLGLALLLVPVSLSGALLVWHDHLDALVNPGRYAVTQGAPQPPAALLASARPAFGEGFQPMVVRLPEDAGWPATVMAREQQRRGEGAGGRPRMLTAYIDPATGRVLDVSEFRTSLIGYLHRFHENLTIPEYSGRAIVGWSGVAMLILSLSGIYLWWPRSGGFKRGLRYRRGPATSFNLHHLVGFWIAIPLAVVSVTGIYLGFPQQGRDLLSSVAPMTPQQRGAFNQPLLAQPRLDADRALAAALEGAAGAQVAAIFLPNQSTGAWRVQLRDGAGNILVDDRRGERRVVAPQSGDRIAQWIRWIHEGSHSGVLWQVLVFICGVLPTLFTITGLMIWLRSRRAKAAMRGPAPQLEAAE